VASLLLSLSALFGVDLPHLKCPGSMPEIPLKRWSLSALFSRFMESPSINKGVLNSVTKAWNYLERCVIYSLCQNKAWTAFSFRLLFNYPNNEGDFMFTELQKKSLENLKKIADEIETRVVIYGDQFGPSDEHVLKLKNELYEVNQRILNLMVLEQEDRVNNAIIE
jgi:hypothetical protein